MISLLIIDKFGCFLLFVVAVDEQQKIAFKVWFFLDLGLEVL